MKLLTQHLGYRPPLQIIADGTFVKAATDHDIAKNYDPQSTEDDPLVQALYKYLNVSFNIFTTISVMNELSMLGPEFRKAARLAKQYKLFPTEFSDVDRKKLQSVWRLVGNCWFQNDVFSAVFNSFSVLITVSTIKHSFQFNSIQM